MRRKKEYAVYKGDNFLIIGTADEIAEHFGIRKETVYFWASPTNKRRANKKRKGSGRKVAETLNWGEEV